jgi:phosphoglucosamine mutase
VLTFGTDGVRGRALDELTPAYVESLGRAAVHVLGGDRWLVGRDTRASGAELVSAFARGATRASVSVIDLGVLPTPAVAFWSHRMGVPAAMVTASHNPWYDNGVKVFAAGGSKLGDDRERAIEEALRLDQAPADSDPVGPAPLEFDPVTVYVDHLVSGQSSLAGVRVVLDCANGAMSAAAPEAFRRLGAEVIVIHDEPDGRNINAECGATATGSLATAVLEHEAALGLAFDGDGDRVIAIDEHGDTVDGDRLIALAALELRRRGELPGNTVVVTVMSNLGFHRAMGAAGIDVVTTAVGDRWVLEALDAGGYAIGGEQSGHIIYRRLATTGDGLLAGLRLAAMVHEHGGALSEIAGSVMTSYPQVLVNVPVAVRHPQVAEELADEIAAAEARLDGDGRVLLRPSGTEALVRVMVEASTDERARAVAEDLAAVVRTRLGA